MKFFCPPSSDILVAASVELFKSIYIVMAPKLTFGEITPEVLLLELELNSVDLPDVETIADRQNPPMQSTSYK